MAADVVIHRGAQRPLGNGVFDQTITLTNRTGHTLTGPRPPGHLSRAGSLVIRSESAGYAS
jgi:hypothetical protein